MRYVYGGHCLLRAGISSDMESTPALFKVRIPLGTQSVILFNSQDAITLHEIFCREDYRCFPAPQVVVDLDRNIRTVLLDAFSPTCCELFEPDPRNVSNLLTNLNGLVTDLRFMR